MVSLLAFAALILVPAVGSYGRGWEKATAAVLSVFVLVALVLVASRSGSRSSTSGTTSPNSSRPGRARLAVTRLVAALPTIPPMSPSRQAAEPARPRRAALDELSRPMESGAGLPAVARAAARVLGERRRIDRSSAVLAVAGSSRPRRAAAVGRRGVETVGAPGRRPRGRRVALPPPRRAPAPAITRTVSTLLGLEVERARSPEWASDQAAGASWAVLSRRVTDRGDLLARASELGAELEAGAGVVIARAAPRSAQAGEWRERVLTVAVRALRSAARGALAAQRGRGGGGCGDRPRRRRRG